VVDIRYSINVSVEQRAFSDGVDYVRVIRRSSWAVLGNQKCMGGDGDDVGGCRLVRRISDTDYTVLLHWIK